MCTNEGFSKSAWHSLDTCWYREEKEHLFCNDSKVLATLFGLSSTCNGEDMNSKLFSFDSILFHDEKANSNLVWVLCSNIGLK